MELGLEMDCVMWQVEKIIQKETQIHKRLSVVPKLRSQFLEVQLANPKTQNSPSVCCQGQHCQRAIPRRQVNLFSPLCTKWQLNVKLLFEPKFTFIVLPHLHAEEEPGGREIQRRRAERSLFEQVHRSITAICPGHLIKHKPGCLLACKTGKLMQGVYSGYGEMTRPSLARQVSGWQMGK